MVQQSLICTPRVCLSPSAEKYSKFEISFDIVKQLRMATVKIETEDAKKQRRFSVLN